MGGLLAAVAQFLLMKLGVAVVMLEQRGQGDTCCAAGYRLVLFTLCSFWVSVLGLTQFLLRFLATPRLAVLLEVAFDAWPDDTDCSSFPAFSGRMRFSVLLCLSVAHLGVATLPSWGLWSIADDPSRAELG